MAQGRSTAIISMIHWIRTSRLSKQSPSLQLTPCTIVGNYEVQADIIERLIYNNINSAAKGCLPRSLT